jgi:hypothetical protein
VELLGASHPVEVEYFLANDGIIIEDFVELA